MRVYFFETKNSNSPIKRFINRLPHEDQARFLEVIEEIESHGLSAARVVFKPLEGKLWEIKFRSIRTGYRVFYVLLEKELMVWLHAFSKKTQKTPKKGVKYCQGENEGGAFMKYKNITRAKSYVSKKLKNQSIKLLFDEERTKTEIARIVRLAREKAGLSQRELAKRAETTQAVVARLELGTDSRMPSLMLICRLLKAADAHLELKCVFDEAA